MDRGQTDWATAYYYVATLWALVGEDFSEEWRRLRDHFDRQLADVPAGHPAAEQLRVALEALQAQVDRVTAARMNSGASREDPRRLVPAFDDLAAELAEFARIVDGAIRTVPVESADEWSHSVDHVRNAVCEFDKVWVSPALAPAFRDAVAYLGHLDLNAVLRHGG